MEKIGNVIYSTYTYNKLLSKKERKIAKKLNKIITKEAKENFPIVMLDLKTNGILDLKSNEYVNSMEIAYQQYQGQFLGNNDTGKYLVGEHVYIAIYLNKKHKKFSKKLIRYAINNLEELIEKEQNLRSKNLTDKDLESFRIEVWQLDE